MALSSVKKLLQQTVGCGEELSRLLERLDALTLGEAAKEVKYKRKSLVDSIQVRQIMLYFTRECSQFITGGERFGIMSLSEVNLPPPMNIMAKVIIGSFVFHADGFPVYMQPRWGLS